MPKETEKTKNQLDARTKPGKRLTLGHIAEQLGVSTATVSLALRDSPLVAEETREKVKETARKVGYIYNRSAASLRTSRSQIVGVAVHDILNPFFAEVFAGLEEVLEEQGQMIFICNHRDDVGRQQAFVNTLLQHRADGLILCPSVGTTSKDINELVDHGLPVTLMAREIESARAPCVRGDDMKGMYDVTRHLIDQGHRNIAMVGGRRDTSTGRFRNAGWRKALTEAGINPDEQIDLPELMTQSDGRAAAETLLEADVRPTAIVAFNDLVALGLMTAFQKQGIEIGTDIAITGYDDIDGSDARNPALTTVSNKAGEIGRTAASTLLKQVAEQLVPNTSTIIEPAVQIRESSQSPGAKLKIASEG